MSEKTVRIGQVVRKLNIGVDTAFDFLIKHGHETQRGDLNSKISEEAVNALQKQFKDAAADKEEASQIVIGGEKRVQNTPPPQPVVATPPPPPPPVEVKVEKPVYVQEDIFKAIEEVAPEPVVKVEPVIEKVVEEPPVQQVEEEKVVEEVKPEPPVANKEQTTGLKVLGKIDLPAAKTSGNSKPQEKYQQKDHQNKDFQKRDNNRPPFNKSSDDKSGGFKRNEPPRTNQPQSTPQNQPKKQEPTKIAPVEPQKPVAVEKPQPEMISAKADQLQGLKVLGKIELPVEKPAVKKEHPNKEKRQRKRVKVKGDKGNTPGQIKTADGQANRPNKPQGQGHHQPGPKPQPKEEISDKEIEDKIKATLAKLTQNKAQPQRAKNKRDRKRAAADAAEQEFQREQEEAKILKVTEFISANDLASLMDVSVNEVIASAMSMGLFVSINQRLDAENITLLADEFGFDVKFVDAEDELAVEEQVDTEEQLLPRAPIVTIMGHVDHGKTSLLDFIRNSKVTDTEAGGITQHIGAYDVMTRSGKRVAFLDTPGHEAFTAMRARGAQVTDVAIIVIAADDSVMPQTEEAINHAKMADVPIVFAFNKMDKPGANADRIRQRLAEMNLLVEEWGGKYQTAEISAKTGMGIDDLLDKVLLEAELLELKANPDKRAVGTVIEASLDKGRGYVATLLVQNGTMSIGDVLLAGAHFGKVKAMFDHRGTKMNKVGPATPVLVLGLDGAPQAGDRFNVMETDREARELASKRAQLQREQMLRTRKHITLEEIGRRRALDNFSELNIILKGDVDGSVEALSDSLLKLSNDEVKVNIIHKGVGQISESDVNLAIASEAIIVGFQVRPSPNAKKIAENEEVQIKLYSIIYTAIEEIKDAIEGMLSPTIEEHILGTAEVRNIFKITKVGTVAGCHMMEGTIKRNSKVRVLRDFIVIHSGEIDTLKREKDDAAEVRHGYDFGLKIKNFNDIKEMDMIEVFEEREVKRTLDR